MTFLFYVILLVVSLALSYILQKRPPTPKAATLGEFQAPTAEEGRAIPVCFGTVKLSAPNVVWYGDLHIEAIKDKSGGSMSKSQTVGYKYFLGMQMAICHGPVDSVDSCEVGGKSVVPAKTNVNVGGNFDHVAWSIYLPTLFGDVKGEGGIGGGADVYYGNQTQTANGYLAGQFGGNGISAYPGLCYAVLHGATFQIGGPFGITIPVYYGSFYLGNSKYLKDWAFIVRRFPTIPGLTAGHEKIQTYDANPACIGYEILTNNVWGLGINPLRIDTTSFLAAAEALYADNFGMSFAVDGAQTADQLLAEVQSTVDCVFYTDPATGLWTMKLIRADYDINTIPSFTADEIVGAPEFGRGSWSETANRIEVSYIDRSQNYSTRSVIAIDSANYATQGQIATVSHTFKGVTNRTLANRLANRGLRNLAYPLAKFKLTLNRKAWNLRPGAPFKFTWQPPEGPGWTNMVLRVTAIRYGSPTSGQITVEAVEDIFGITTTVFNDPADTGWNPPLTNPVAPVAQRLVEAPYIISGTARNVYALASRGDSTTFRAEIWTEKGGVGSYAHTGDMTAMTPSGPLKTGYSYRTAALDTTGFTITITAGVDISPLISQNTDTGGLYRGDNIALIDDELVSWQTCTDNGDGSYTFAPVLRGIADTIPVDHALGARVWFVSEGMGLTDFNPYPADLTLNAKILPVNPLGTFPIASASIVSLTTISRSLNPYPPGGAKVKTHKYVDWPATITDDAVFSWIHRDRIAEGVGTLVISQDDPGTPYTPEGTLTLEVLVGGVVKQTVTGSTATSYTYTAAQRTTDDPDGTKSVQFRITPKNGSKTGNIRTTPPIIMTGAGMCAGLYCGGIEA